MIKINKTQPVQCYFIYEGTSREEDKCESETQNACTYFESENYNPDERCEYTFKTGIYGNKKWKKQLLEDQFNKCCFCESKVAHVDAGDVEHFRPKGGYKQSNSDSLQKPGYYWLAYKWDNLLIACQRCNRREKLNLFPLLNSDDRACPTNKNISIERPVFINPSIDNPENFIKFNFEQPFGIDGEERGQRTLDELDLVNNESLNEIRRSHLDRAKGLIDTINIIFYFLDQPDDDISDVLKISFGSKSMGELLTDSFDILLAYLEDSSHYTGMIRSNFEIEIEELKEKYDRLIN